MSEVIKTISLDDIGGVQGQAKEAPLGTTIIYNPQYSQGEKHTSNDLQSALAQSIEASRSRKLGRSMSGFGPIFTHISSYFGKTEKRSRPRTLALIAGAVLALLALMFFLTGSEGADGDFLQTLNTWLGLTDGSSPEVKPMPSSAKAPTGEVESVPADDTAQISTTDLVNPYWALPNPLAVPEESGDRPALVPSQEEQWRQGLAHPFVWQRYKTIKEMRAARVPGSQYLLLDALAQPKFWARMEALIALAELGEVVDIDTVDSALGPARRSLVQNYFRRFRTRSTAGELYVMRQVIRLADAGTRQVILENLVLRRDEVNDLYLVAATYDPNARIHDWISEQLVNRPLSDAAKQRFQQLASGVEEKAAPAPKSAEPPPRPGANPAVKVEDLKVEELPAQLNVEEVYFLKEEDRQEAKPVLEKPPEDDGFQDLEQSSEKPLGKESP